ncbi:hypothetical protein A0H81_03787 [Grifola frondosa]|uniref:Uncharacterized protein n=1 Tax=Grifola frondosa TaxID=5627 RepID=A0A1C7MHK3_GRIFR|nr:hypothetical protein A0H81_03787 [Grifola frondosa]
MFRLTANASRRVSCRQFSSTRGTFNSQSPTVREFKVFLDHETLYVDQGLAEALGWKPDQGVEGVQLTLSGWAPHYFAIARTGSDSDLLARGTVESSRNPKVQQVLEFTGAVVDIRFMRIAHLVTAV